MKAHGFVLALSPLAISASVFSPASAQEESLTCWRHLTHEVPGVVNTVAVCRSGGKAQIAIHFPNTGADATDCSADGILTVAGQTLDFAFEAGSCRNGNSTAPVALSCRQGAYQALDCDDHNGHELDFSPAGIAGTVPDFPIGLRVEHSPNPVRAMEGGRSGHAYTYAFRTSISAIEDQVRIVEFAAYYLVDGEWVFGNVTGLPFTATDFADWYGCPDAIIRPGISCTDTNNWSGAEQLHSQKARWYYFGVTEDGRRVMGWAEIEELPELIAESDSL